MLSGQTKRKLSGSVVAGLLTLTLISTGSGSAQAAPDKTGPTFTMQFSAHIIAPSTVIGVQGYPAEEEIQVQAIQKWAATDSSGICDYQLYDYDARDYPTLQYEGLATSYSFLMGDVQEGNGGYWWYHWILRVQDCAGNWSNNDDWGSDFFPTTDRFISQPGAKDSTVTHDDTEVKFSGAWATSKCTCFIDGTNRNATKKGASATFTYTGAVAGWVTETGPKRGKAKVYQDGVLKATVNLNAKANSGARVMWSNWFPTVGKHTLKIVVVGTKGHSRVDVDAFLVGPNSRAS